MAAACPAAFI